jgi:hypothetical protein
LTVAAVQDPLKLTPVHGCFVGRHVVTDGKASVEVNTL